MKKYSDKITRVIGRASNAATPFETLNWLFTDEIFYDIAEHTSQYTGCHRRNGPNFGRVFLMLKYTDITQNTYVQS
jgi:hypothetical protein